MRESAPLIFLTLAGTPACRGATYSETPPAADAAAQAPPTCTPPPADGGYPAYESVGSGTVSGTDLGATFCNVGFPLYEQTYGNPANQIYLAIDTNSPSAVATMHLPTGAVSGTVTGLIQVPAAAPGVYGSSDASLCGALSFSYGLPVASETECEADAGPNGTCPTGCLFTYLCPPSDAGFEGPCCVPLATTFVYQAGAATSCNGAAQAVLGSWTLTLSSVAPYAGDAGYQYGLPSYVAHGTLTATLTGTTGTTGTASLSLSF
jgi:hypothetical protein